jgi:hypothetical protein
MEEDRMRLKVALATGCLLAAVLALLLARDVWHWRKAIRDADARAQIQTLDASTWRAGETLPWHAARNLLGVRDDIAFRRLYVRAAYLATKPPREDRTRLRTPNEVLLKRAISVERDPARASAAANVLGLLLFTDPADIDSGQAERAVGAFQDAVLIDPRNDAAKSNLELMLRQIQSQSPKGRSSPGGGDTGGKGGVGLDKPGRGY